MDELPFEGCFQVLKRERQCIQVEVRQFEEPLYFSFSTLSGSIQFWVLFAAAELDGVCCMNSALDLAGTSNFSSILTISNEIEPLRSGFDLECNYFASSGKYFCFPSLGASEVPREVSVEKEHSFVEIVPNTRYPSSKMTIRGKITLPTSGKCFFIFDNSFSVQKAKRVYACINQTGHIPCGWLYSKKSAIAKKYWVAYNEQLDELRVQKKPSHMSKSSSKETAKIKGELLEMAVIDIQKLKLVIKLKNGTSIVMGTKRYSELKYWNDILNSAGRTREHSGNASKLDLCAANENKPNFISNAKQSTSSLQREEIYYSNDSSSDDCESFYDAASIMQQTEVTVGKRKSLPAQMQQLNIKIMDLIRKPKGPFPIHFNEPLTLLQKMCEDLEYAESLLSREALQRNEFEAVCAFAISCYASHRFRDRKPFNPLLGETFEFQHGNIRYFSEKVSHDPLVIATHTTGETFELWNCFKIQTQLKGISVEVCLQGKNHLKILASGHLYEWNKANTMVKSNLGQKSIETNGTIVLVETTKRFDSAEIRFKSSSFFSKTANYEIDGCISQQGIKTALINGDWDKEVWLSDLQTKSRKIIFAPNPHPPNHKDNYGFTEFAMNLNCKETACSPIDFLPMSDSRNRSDLQLYEKGLSDEAQQIKQRLEQEQRDRFKGENKQQAKWFELSDSSEWTAKRHSDNLTLLYWYARDQGKCNFGSPNQ